MTSENSSQVSIRQLLPEDSGRVVEILNAACNKSTFPIGPVWSTQQLLDECRQAEGYVAHSTSGVVQSFVLYRDVGEAWDISFLATDPSFQGKGLMAALLTRIQGELPIERAIWLEVHEANLAAKGLYERLGFRLVGVRRQYYSDGAAACLYVYDNRT